MNMNAKNMSDYESHEENEDIIFKLKNPDKATIKEKTRKLNYSIISKMDPLVENSKLIFNNSRWKKDKNPKEEI